MGMRALESAVLAELRFVEKNRKIRLKDIQEWSTGEVKPHEGEKLVHLTIFGNQPVNVAYKLPEPKKKEEVGA